MVPGSICDSLSSLCGSTTVPFKTTSSLTWQSSPITALLHTRAHWPTEEPQPTIESETHECGWSLTRWRRTESRTRAPVFDDEEKMFFWFFSSPGKKVSFFLLLFVLLLFVARTKHLSTSRPNKRRERERESRNKLTGAQHAVLADANVGPDLAPRADLSRGVDEDVALDRVVAAGAGERGRVLGAEGAEVELEACVAEVVGFGWRAGRGGGGGREGEAREQRGEFFLYSPPFSGPLPPP